jgi:hypothetical protein
MDKPENLFGSKPLTAEQRERKRRILHKPFRDEFADHSPRCECYDCRKMRKHGRRTVYTRSQLREREKDKEELEEQYSEFWDGLRDNGWSFRTGGWPSGSRRRS